jgi:CopG antitoxin of type II toxin-antitoxin system
MGNAKNKRTTQRDPLPEHFDSLEEAAEFWDTHDSGDYEEYFTDVEGKFDIKKKSYLISMDGSLYDEVRAIAKKKRIPPDKLIIRWMKEKLRSAA